MSFFSTLLNAEKPSIWSTDGGIFFGYEAESMNKKYSRGEEVLYKDDRQLCTTGPSGSGKTMRLIYQALKRNVNWSIVLVDPKAKLCRLTYEHRKKAGSYMMVQDPFGISGYPSTGYNFLSALDPNNDDFSDDASGQSENMIPVEGNDPHWPRGAQDLSAGTSMWVRRFLPNGSLADVRTLLAQNEKGFRDFITGANFDYEGVGYPGVTGGSMKAPRWPEMLNKLARFGDIKPDSRELQSIISSALTATRWLDSRRIKKDLKGPAFDFETLKHRPTTVYLCMPPRRMATHATYMRMMLEAITQGLMRDPNPGKVPVLLILDEYPLIAGGDTGRAGLPVIDKNISLFREYGVKAWTCWQTLGQILDIYGEHGAQTFFSSAGVLQAFAPQDPVTAEYLSRRTGQTTAETYSQGESQSYQPGTVGSQRSENMNRNYIGRAPYLPQDFMNGDDGYSVLFSHKIKGGYGFSYAPFPKV